MLSGFCAAMSSVLFYVAMVKLSVSEVYTIFSTLAILNGLLGALILNEPYSTIEKIAGGVSFLGVVLIVRPPFLFGSEEVAADTEDSGLPHWFAGVLALGSTLAYSLYQIGVRKIRSEVDPMVIAFYTNLNGVFWFGLYFIFFGEYKSSSFGEYFGCFIFGATYLVGNVVVSYALQHTTVSVVGLLGYSQLIFSLIVDILLFATFPSGLTLFGAALIVGSCLWLVTRKN